MPPREPIETRGMATASAFDVARVTALLSEVVLELKETNKIAQQNVAQQNSPPADHKFAERHIVIREA